MLDGQARIVDRGSGQLLESLRKAAICIGAQRTEVDIDTLQRQAPIVGSGIDIKNIEMVFQERDRGQDGVAIQTVGIEIIGSVVGRHHEDHAMTEKAVQQALENHGIGHIRDMKLIETDQAIPRGKPAGDLIERITHLPEITQFAMHAAHELMKVHPGLAHHRYGFVEHIHEQALAASDTAIHPDAAWHRRAIEQLAQQSGPPALEFDQIIVKPLQPFDRSQLRSVAAVATFGQQLCVALEDVHLT